MHHIYTLCWVQYIVSAFNVVNQRLPKSRRYVFKFSPNSCGVRSFLGFTVVLKIRNTACFGGKAFETEVSRAWVTSILIRLALTSFCNGPFRYSSTSTSEFISKIADSCTHCKKLNAYSFLYFSILGEGSGPSQNKLYIPEGGPSANQSPLPRKCQWGSVARIRRIPQRIWIDSLKTTWKMNFWK